MLMSFYVYYWDKSPKLRILGSYYLIVTLYVFIIPCFYKAK